MTTVFYALGTLIVVAVLYFAIRVPVRKYLEARGDRLVSCPDNGQEVAVRVDAVHAAVTPNSVSGHLRLESCTRWPEKVGCGQECLRQIEAQPDDCLVRMQVDRWYADKSCVLCGKALGDLDWTVHKPAVRSPEGLTVEWHDIKPESLWGVLSSHDPVCWDCHVAETFRRQRPDLVLDHPHAPGSRT
ncbi:MAG: hypothetical protein Q7V01_08985 [Vicinamibacterales bacterium]|nr:hypothetical protein [Vicinamibacterales bacterium]